MRICSRCKLLLAPDARRCPTDGAASETVDRLPNGARIGGYQIEKLLGEGGMGFVYEATHEVLRRRTAIKFLRPELAGHPQVVARFLQEAKAVNVIDHPNIINVYDYGDGADGSVYFVMEFLEGETLDDLMRKRRPMAPPMLLHVFGQVLKALAAAHAKKIVHRDLKPANVFVTPREGNPYFIKVLDFGIAQLRGEGAIAGLTVAGSVMGTPQYMSPEQVTGRAVDARSDVWALGAMLYRAATGVAPFRGEGFGALADKILHDTPKRPSEHVSSIAPSLDRLIASCLERELQDRCASVDQMIAGLERVKREYELDDDAILAAVKLDAGAATEPLPVQKGDHTRGSLVESRPIYQGVVASPADAPRRSRARLAIGATAAVLAVAAGGYFVFGRSGSAPAATPAPAVAAPAVSIERRAGAAERGLHDAIASGDLQLQGQAVDAIALVSPPRAARLLYLALGGRPELRVRAARALAGLKLPDAAPKVRAALDDSGDRVRVELAASLTALGDRDALAILRRATTDPAMKLTAAVALAEAGDDQAARPVLIDVFAGMPEGREPWRRAAGGLMRIGDAKGRTALEGELAQHDPARAVAAAELLARTGDPGAHDYLARVARDPEFARRGEASLALARLGDQVALEWVATGLASTDVDDRRFAIAVCGRLAKHAARLAGEVARLATEDPDRSVRLTADAALMAF
jgi:serine/threonine protein kinase/HEAT repeat protein